MLQRFRFVIVSALVILTSAGVSYAVSASMPNALLTAGTTRYATASATNSELTYPSDGWVNVPGITKYITIPAGKTADVMVIFCGMAWTSPGDELWTCALIRDVAASPGETLLQTDNNTASQCAMFYKTNVTAGSPAVKMQWRAAGSINGAFLNAAPCL